MKKEKEKSLLFARLYIARVEERNLCAEIYGNFPYAPIEKEDIEKEFKELLAQGSKL